ncbi:MAG: discoidin domain-containing protein [Eubacteriales bacterium]|nr:discoidin domain-containing protein [Eubacteriales bacterium]MDD4475764.1 discoidin domain-containing protein [Eubacteriales bacterium]
MKKALFLAILSCILLLSLCFTTIAAETNVAEGATYTYDKKTPVASNGGDPDSTKLTDAVFAEANSLWDGQWVVFESKEGNTDSSILIDLGAAFDISKISFKMLIDSQSGASLPVTLKVAIGASSSSLTEVASESYEWVDGTDAKDFTKTLDSAVSARYIKLSITGRDYGWNTYFGFDEVMVYESDAVTEESKTETSKPADTTESKAESKPSTPETGDSFVYVSAMMVMSVAAAACVIRRKAR